MGAQGTNLKMSGSESECAWVRVSLSKQESEHDWVRERAGPSTGDPDRENGEGGRGGEGAEA